MQIISANLSQSQQGFPNPPGLPYPTLLSECLIKFIEKRHVIFTVIVLVIFYLMFDQFNRLTDDIYLVLVIFSEPVFGQFNYESNFKSFDLIYI